MGKLRYKPMDSVEYDKYIQGALEDYISDISMYEEEFVNQMKKSPREFAEQQFTENLPEGVNSPDNVFWMATNSENNEEIGFLWFTLIPDKNLCLLSLIKVFEDFRGRGYGTEILHDWEIFVTKEHPEIHRLYLHVFKHNPRAKKLYEIFRFTLFYESFEGDNLIKEINSEAKSS